MSQKIKIYHNLACGTSRNTLELIRSAGQEEETRQWIRRLDAPDIFPDQGLL